MEKYFIVADVHGFYDEMMTALNEKGFDIENPNHIFVSLGDLFDRGKQPNEVLDFVIGLPEERRILILGNHELLMEQALSRGFFNYTDYCNGTKGTAYRLTNSEHDEDAILNLKKDQRWKDYIRACQFYAEIGDNIFVHGWIPSIRVPSSWGGIGGLYEYKYDWREAPIYDWKEATWINGMSAWYQKVREPGKTIWCGHWHTSWGHYHLHGEGVEFAEKPSDVEHFEPFKDEGIVAMDACTAHSHKINCEVIEIQVAY